MLKKIKSHTKKWVANRKEGFSRSHSPRRLTMCKKCYTFYYKNSWHFDKPMQLDLSSEKDVSVFFTDCSSCLAQEVAGYDQEDLVLGRV